MNRKLLIQVAAPTVIIGFLLFGTCLVSAWYINRLQSNIASIRSSNVASLLAAQQLEIAMRQVRFHCYIYLIAPSADVLQDIHKDDLLFEEWLVKARLSSSTAVEQNLVQAISDGYLRYQQEFERLRTEGTKTGQPRRDFQELAKSNPVLHVVTPCRELVKVNEEMLLETSQESDRVSSQLRAFMLFLGLGGPISGLIMGYGIARGLSRSIYQLSVHVQDLAQHLDQDVASVSVLADSDLRHLDRQLQHVVGRVQEVAERVQQHQRELLHAQQLSAIGQLAASVAHEVRNPLTAMKMLVDAARRARNRKPLSQDDLEVIHGEIARLEQTVQDFLDFARLPSPRRSICDLRDVIGQAADLVRARARQQEVEIALQSPPNPVTGHVDRNQLCTVLVNLFLNALDVMPHGGRLEVQLGAARRGKIHLSITDTGSGIPAEMLGLLFTPFTSSKATGTGLGLSISQRIVAEHGGEIHAENRPEGGARFELTLPAMKGEKIRADTSGH